MKMGGKNGIIIDGVFHELKESKKKDCGGCSLYDLCKKEFGSACVCWIGLESKSVDSSGMFFNRGKVKVITENQK